MNPKSLILLEFHKVLDKLKSYTTFELSTRLAGKLRPTSSLEKRLTCRNRPARRATCSNSRMNLASVAQLICSRWLIRLSIK